MLELVLECFIESAYLYGSCNILAFGQNLDGLVILPAVVAKREQLISQKRVKYQDNLRLTFHKLSFKRTVFHIADR